MATQGPTLDEYEVKVLRELNGEKVEGLSWGGAMGAAIEGLKSMKLVEKQGFKYVITDAGKKFLARQRLRVVGG